MAHVQMINIPPHLMRRPTTFIAPAGPFSSVVATYNMHITKIKYDIELRSGAYDKLKEGEPRYPQAKRGRNGQLPQAPSAGAASSSYDFWGDCTQRHGIWCAHTGAICFGSRCLVEFADGSNLPKVTCLAALYVNAENLIVNHRRWCSGEHCTDADHARPRAAAGKALRITWLRDDPRSDVTNVSGSGSGSGGGGDS